MNDHGGNDVVLVGRLSGVTDRVLPSGDEVTTFRVVVDRPVKSRGPSGRVTVDAIDCSAWTATVRRRVRAIADGEWVEIQGALRRRFWRAGAVPTSRVEVETRSVRRVS